MVDSRTTNATNLSPRIQYDHWTRIEVGRFAPLQSDEQIGAPKPPTVPFLMAELLGGGSVTSVVPPIYK